MLWTWLLQDPITDTELRVQQLCDGAILGNEYGVVRPSWRGVLCFTPTESKLVFYLFNFNAYGKSANKKDVLYKMVVLGNFSAIYFLC